VTEREMELALKKNDSRENGALVTLALKTLECEQKKLAKRLGVSETQITKWKQGESMSHEKQTKLRKLIGIDMYTDVAFVLAGGGGQMGKADDVSSGALQLQRHRRNGV